MRPLLLAALVPLGSAVEVYQAPSPEPTPEETLILEYLNRFRADPGREADLIAPNDDKIPGVYGQVDVAMFRREMKALKPSPPVVFNLALLDAARKHSFYMVHNGLTHVEEPGKTGFVAADFAARIAKAGYAGLGAGEDCYAQARDPWASHVGFVVDFGAGGEGGMQAGRGHRTNMHNPRFREVGPGAVANGQGLSVTHELADRGGVARFAGGVAFIDLDGDGFYDVGEGRGNVTISASDGVVVRTWASGAFTLELKSTAMVTLQAEWNGQKFRKAFPAGSENLKFDWAMPADADHAVADALLAEVDKAKDPASPASFKALVALYLGSRDLHLDDERRGKIAALTKEVGAQLDAARAAAREALAGDAKAFRKVVADQAKPFKGTAAAGWFKQIETLQNARQAVGEFEKAGKPPAAKARELLQSLEAQRDGTDDGDLRAQFSLLVGRVRAAGG